MLNKAPAVPDHILQQIQSDNQLEQPPPLPQNTNTLQENDSDDIEYYLDDVCALVIDNGSHTIKAGFGGGNMPRAVFPTIIGRPKVTYVGGLGKGQKDAYVGDEVQSKRGILWVKRPMEYSIVTNWDDMEKIWHHTFYNELRCAPEDHPVFLTESIDNPQINREKTTQIMFETFNVPLMYIENQNKLSLFAGGRMNGIVINSGYECTNIVPIYNGHCLMNAAKRLDIGGRIVTDYMMKICCERGYAFTTTNERLWCVDIKKKMGYVAIDFDDEMKNPKEQSYELPDGQVVVFGNERFRWNEIMFKPNFVGMECDGIRELLYDSVMKIDNDMELKEIMWENIVLCGGNTLFNGFKERLKNDLKIYNDIDVKIDAQLHRLYTVWIGGSIMSELSSFKDKWITKDIYDEYGPTVVNWHCF